MGKSEGEARRHDAREPDSRERIVRAAVKLFGEQGFERSTVRSISTLAGTNPGLVPYYFAGGKEELWRAAADHVIGVATADFRYEVARYEHAEPRARLEAALRALVYSAARYPEMYRFIQAAADGSSTDRHDWMLDEHTRPAMKLLVEALGDGVDAGLLPAVDKATLVYMVIGAATQPYLLHREVEQVMGIDPFSDEAIKRHADAIVTTFVHSPTGSTS